MALTATGSSRCWRASVRHAKLHTIRKSATSILMYHLLLPLDDAPAMPAVATDGQAQGGRVQAALGRARRARAGLRLTLITAALAMAAGMWSQPATACQAGLDGTNAHADNAGR